MMGLLAAQDWPSWRGPKGGGTSAESGFPVRWSATENVVWKVPVPGIGHSSPITWGGPDVPDDLPAGRKERRRLCFEAGTGKLQLVLSGSKSVVSYDPASGEPWRVPDGPAEQFVASLVYSDGFFYVVSDTGTASALEAKTGRRLWSEKRGGHHSSSPVAAGGLLYFPDDSGAVHVLKAGAAFERVAKNELAEECTASPALSRGRIYMRTKGHLWCLSEGGK